MQPPRFEIPEQMREAADRSVSQARKAVEQFLDATQKAAATATGPATGVGEGAADLQRQSLAFLEENVAASFDLAHRLVQARTLEEMAALQQEFLRKQMAAAAQQAGDLSTMAARAVGDLGPKSKG